MLSIRIKKGKIRFLSTDKPVNISKISVLGCGWLGFPLALALAEAGYQITTASRSAIADDNQAQGIRHIHQAIYGQSPINPALLDCELLIINIPCKDLHAFSVLFKALESQSHIKVIYVSSTSVYQNSDAPVNEEKGPFNLASPIYQIEQSFKEIETLPLNILRFAGLLGYNRHPARFIKPGRVIPAPNHRVNMIHRDDCIGILVKLIELNKWGLTLNACADSHPLRLDFYTQAARHAGLPLPDFAEDNPAPGKVISNHQLKRVLHYRFQYPDLLAWSHIPYLLPHIPR